ncbi:MAG: lysozyme [Phenylobacterium sp. RIFCSPHIGHO2_01_FULL_70_10]|nr:MAG: lysozyme [Phenylobacterium sp. RIFCSPHIGHO2_01_FULL_70_10]
MFQQRKGTDFIVVHCSATPPTHDWGRAEIDRVHRKQGWLGIGYHYVIKRDGTVEEGRPRDTVGAHVEGFNARSIGICMVGGVAADGKKAENNFTPAQFDALAQLLGTLKRVFPKAAIQGHRDFPGVKKDCPSFDVRSWLKTRGL